MIGYWHRRRRSRRKEAAAVLAAFLAFVLGFAAGLYYVPACVPGDYAGAGREAAQPARFAPFDYGDWLPQPGTSNAASVGIPAVDTDGNGMVTVLSVQAFPGSGRILTDIDKLLFWIDTQNSIRRATAVAQNISGVNLSGYDIIYTVHANASVIGGPSAGPAIAIATIAALTNRTINHSVMITGSLNHDGSIGPVGGVLEKARAARMAGADVFLVPLAQSIETTYDSREFCDKIGWMDFCTTETYPVRTDVGAEAGIAVAEVMNIMQAAELMIV